MKLVISSVSITIVLSCSVIKPTYKVEKTKYAEKYASTITQEELKKHLEIIASDDYEGRETGKKGQKMTAEYLKNQLTSYGVAPGNKGSNFQYFPLIETNKPQANILFHNKDFRYAKEFYFYATMCRRTAFPGFAPDTIRVVLPLQGC